jgi:hypothetical protein
MAKETLAISLLFATIIFTGCGSGSGSNSMPGKPIDPSGNWSMKLTDASNHQMLFSGLFSQTGSTVTALNILDAGNPAPFSCTGSMSMSNGTVQNVDQFSGDVAGGWGTFHFASTLNAAGTHAGGTYTLTAGAQGNCANIASSGTFTGDEVPSVSGTWSGTVSCASNCPVGATSGTISATLTQNDSTGAVTGTYAVSGLPDISSGTFSTGQFDFLSGASWQDTVTDNNGNVYAIAGGPVQGAPFNSAGLGLDKTFQGFIIEQKNHDPNLLNLPTYSVSMSH